jgi:hypothetical protein
MVGAVECTIVHAALDVILFPKEDNCSCYFRKLLRYVETV